MKTRYLNGWSSLHARFLRAPDGVDTSGAGGGGGGGSPDAAANAAPAGDGAGTSAAPAAGTGTALGGSSAPAAKDGSAEGGAPAAGTEANAGGDPGGDAGKLKDENDGKPPENETDEEKAAREALEAEEAGKHAPKDGVYEPFTLPDGYAIEDEAQAEFAAFAVANDMNQERAQQAIDLYVQQRQKENQVWFDQVASWRETSEKDPEIGGKDRGEKIAIMRQARDMFGEDKELTQLFETVGIGDHPALQRYFYRVGKSFAGGSRTTHGDGPPKGSNSSLGSRLYD